MLYNEVFREGDELREEESSVRSYGRGLIWSWGLPLIGPSVDRPATSEVVESSPEARLEDSVSLLSWKPVKKMTSTFSFLLLLCSFWIWSWIRSREELVKVHKEEKQPRSSAGEALIHVPKLAFDSIYVSLYLNNQYKHIIKWNLPRSLKWTWWQWFLLTCLCRFFASFAVFPKVFLQDE